jgi:penicillin-binding protein 2
MNLENAIEQSCNDYFIERGKVLKMEDLRAVFKEAGFGKKSMIGLPERAGKLPSREGKKKTSGLAWNQYDSSLLCIGQGYILVTPIQIALYTAALANGGILYQPQLLKEIRNSAGTILYKTTPHVTGRLENNTKDLEIIKEGMHLVVNASDGSGRSAKNSLIELSGKTGTAEIRSKGKRQQNTWFICFGKAKKTNYALAVLVEDGASGGQTCAPIAKAFFMKYLKEK